MEWTRSEDKREKREGSREGAAGRDCRKLQGTMGLGERKRDGKIAV